MIDYKKIIGIDASNIQQGGGVTHLIELLYSFDLIIHKDSRVIIWGQSQMLMKISNYPWLLKKSPMLINSGFLKRTVWQLLKLSTQAKNLGCDLLFIVGGSFVSPFRPVVVMSRNMLPFDYRELFRYGFSLITFKFILLRWVQSSSFRNADGVIFLTNYARDNVLNIIGKRRGSVSVIPHGLSDRFSHKVKDQKEISFYTADKPYQLLYVSSIYPYKHQWNVVEAVAMLRKKGYQLKLMLVGPSFTPSLKLLKRVIKKHDPNNKWVNYYGEVDYNKINKIYKSSDMGIFASTCENMPNILLEMMAAGLPIVCSNKGPMPEILGDTGLYFDAEKPEIIASSILDLIISSDLRSEKAYQSQLRSSGYSWEKCSINTIQYINQIINNHQR